MMNSALEADMDLNFPFPTLKQLSLVSIGQRLANKSCRFAGFPDLPNSYQDDDENYDEKEVKAKFHLIVKNLPLPLKFRRDVVTVSMRLYDQLWHWLKYRGGPYTRMYTEYDLIFDVNGIVDESRTLERHFEKTFRMKKAGKEYLRNSLEIACCRTTVPHISMMLRKMLISEGAGATHLEGPRKAMANGKLTLAYTFRAIHEGRKVHGRRSPYDILRWLNDGIYMHNIRFKVTKRAIRIIHLNPMQNVDTLKEYPNLLLESLHNGSIYRVVSESTECIRLVIKLLNHEDRVRFLQCANPETTLTCFLRWPFTRFFVPLMTFLDRYYNVNGRKPSHFYLFSIIIDKIPAEQEMDVFGYGDLLLEFWDSLPSHVKQNFQNPTSECRCVVNVYNSEVRDKALKRLLEKNATLYSLMSKRIFS